MDNLISRNNLTAIVSFEDSLEKLHSCILALNTWIPQIIVVLPEGKVIEKEILDNLKASVCTKKAHTTKSRWESGLNQTNTPWALLIRSNEVVTGQLRKIITDKIKTCEENPYTYTLPLTMVFLKKRLKYSVDWHDSQLSSLVHIPKSTNSASQQTTKTLLSGELIRYGEDTLSDCASAVARKSEERAANLAKCKIIFICFSLSSPDTYKIFLLLELSANCNNKVDFPTPLNPIIPSSTIKVLNALNVKTELRNLSFLNGTNILDDQVKIKQLDILFKKII